MIYRLFPRDTGGKILPGQEFTAGDDGDAMVIARLMAAAGKGEVWQGARLVGTLFPRLEDLPTPAVQ